MAIVPNLTDIQSGFLTAAAHNENNARLTAALEKAINREGGDDNNMEADLDMGLNRIINVQDAITPFGATNYQQVLDMVSGYLIKAKDILVNSYNIMFSDGGKLLRVNTTEPSTIIVPVHSSAPFVKGTIVHVRQVGPGQVNIVAEDDSLITINLPQGEDFTSGQGFGLALVNIKPNVWDLVKSYTGVAEEEFDWEYEAVPFSEGSYTLPGGLEVKFGSFVTVGELTQVPYTEPFDNDTIFVTTSLAQNPGNTSHALWAEQFTAEGFVLGQMGLTATRVNWLAIGA